MKTTNHVIQFMGIYIGYNVTIYFKEISLFEGGYFIYCWTSGHVDQNEDEWLALCGTFADPVESQWRRLPSSDVTFYANIFKPVTQ